MELDRIVALFETQPLLGRALAAVLGLAVLLALRVWIQRVLGRRLEDSTLRYRSRKIVGFGTWLLLLLFLGVVFSEYLGGLTVALGVASAGIAFALQEVIVSVAGWLTIVFGGYYKTGDRVMLGGIRGDVIDVGILRTTLFELGDWTAGDTYNGRVVRVANSFVFKEPVFNYSADFTFLWDEIAVPVRHDSDRAEARAILERVVQESAGPYAQEVRDTWDDMTRRYLLEKARVEPMVTLTMDENWLTYRIRYPVDYRRRRLTQDALFESILHEFDRTEGRVRVATVAQEVTVVGPSMTEAPAVRRPEK